MIAIITLILAAVWIVVSLIHSGWCFMLVLSMFGLEQLLQASAGLFREGRVGGAATNVGIAVIAGVCALKQVRSRPGSYLLLWNSAQFAIVGLYLWTALSVLWSPGRTAGSEVIIGAVPYFVLYVIVAPLLVTDASDLRRALRFGVVACILMSIGFLLNPEFTQRSGRLGLALGTAGGAVRSNPLAIGDLGGITILLGALFAGRQFTRAGLLLQIAGIASGTILTILSGSRGQLLAALASVVIGLPLTRELKSVRAFIGVVVASIVLLPLILFVASTALSSGSAEQARRWDIFGAESDTTGRLQSASVLMSEFASSPQNWIYGFGFYAFSEMPNALSEYTHVLSADMLGEEGFIGFTLYVSALVLTVRAGKRLIQSSSGDPFDRRAYGTLIALAIFQFILAHKQGNIMGSWMLFLLMAVINILDKKQTTVLLDDETSSASGA
jgi:hypothetical protein